MGAAPPDGARTGSPGGRLTAAAHRGSPRRLSRCSFDVDARCGMLRFMSDAPVPVSEREAAVLADPVVVAAIVAGVEEAHAGKVAPVDWSVFDE